MTAQTTRPMIYGSIQWYAGTAAPSTTSGLLDAVNDYIAVIFRAPITGTISHIEYYIGSVNGSSGGSAVVDCRVETVDAATGLPTGTLWGTNTNGSQTLLFTDDATWFSTALTSTASVTKGDVVAIMVKLSSLTGTTTQVNLQLNNRLDSHFTYTVADSGTGAAKNTSRFVVCMLPRFSTDVYPYIPAIQGWKTTTSYAMNTGAATRRLALKFRVPFPTKLSEVQMMMALASTSSDFNVKVYQSDGTTQIGTTLSVDASQFNNTTLYFPQVYDLPAEIDISANTDYYISVEPTTANNVTMHTFNYESNSRLGSTPLGVDCIAATHNGTSWTDVSTSQPVIFPIFTQADDGAGGGGGGTGSIFSTPIIRAA